MHLQSLISGHHQLSFCLITIKLGENVPLCTKTGYELLYCSYSILIAKTSLLSHLHFVTVKWLENLACGEGYLDKLSLSVYGSLLFLDR